MRADLSFALTKPLTLNVLSLLKNNVFAYELLIVAPALLLNTTPANAMLFPAILPVNTVKFAEFIIKLLFSNAIPAPNNSEDVFILAVT